MSALERIIIYSILIIILMLNTFKIPNVINYIYIYNENEVADQESDDEEKEAMII